MLRRVRASLLKDVGPEELAVTFATLPAHRAASEPSARRNDAIKACF